MDAVQKAGSGHPGTAMSLAPAAYLLYQNVLRHDPADPNWLGRDRFVLSCGHSSLTLYIELYLSGYGLSLDDLKRYREWGSLTPGHPEHGLTPGVETTTGPLGQGLANAVGMAMAARRERGLLDPDAPEGTSPFDHHVYVFVSDGDIEEGISHEVSSLAAHQDLGNLVVLYDDNQISIEDNTQIAKSEDVAARYEAYGWHVQRLDWRRPERLPRGPGRAVPGAAGSPGPHRQALPHRAADGHRLACPARPEHRGGARRRPRRGRGRRDQGSPRLRPEGDVPGRGSTGRARQEGGRAGQAPARRVGRGLQRVGPGQPGAGRAAGTAPGPAAAGRVGQGAARLPPGPEGHGDPQGVGGGTERPRPGAARAVGRLGRPGGQQQHHDEGRAVVHPGRAPDRDVPRQRVRPDPALRDPRARAWGGSSTASRWTA